MGGKAGKRYGTVSWADIRQLVENPAAVEKDDAQFVILSTYIEHDGRSHEAQRLRGEYRGLAADIDNGNPSLEDVAAAARAAAPGAAAIIYSSSSASPEKRKWRVLFELAAPLHGADYKDTQDGLFDLLEARGLTLDRTLNRSGQPIFLPNVPPERRGPDDKPLFYQRAYLDGRPLELTPGTPIVEAREARRRQRAAEAAETARRQEEAAEARRAYLEATGDDFDPVEHFNAAHTIESLLKKHGFQANPKSSKDYHHPKLQGSKSYSTQDRGGHWVAVSAWAHAHNVGRESKGGFRYGTAFDLFAHFEHEGDKAAAILAYITAVRPDIVEDSDKLKRLIEWSMAGRSRPRDVEQLPGRGPARSIDDVREEIAGKLAAAIQQPGPLHLFRPATGTGKTTLALEAAITSRVEAAYAADREDDDTKYPESFAMSLPTHTNVREVEQAAKRLNLKPAAYPQRSEHNCGHIGRANKAAAMGLDVFAAVCESCPLAAQCRNEGYLADVKKANESTFKIGTHDRAVVGTTMTADADAIIIDEDPARALAPTYSADIADVRAVLAWATTIRDELQIDRGKILEPDEDQRIFAAALVNAAARIMSAADGTREVDLALSPANEAEARRRKASVIWHRKHERDRVQKAATLSKTAKAAKAELARQIEELTNKKDASTEDVQKLAELKERAAVEAAERKQITKRVRAAKAALKRARSRAVHTFHPGGLDIAFGTYPPGRVIELDLPKSSPAPENWSQLVFRWAERFGAGAGVNAEARKIVMLAATGGLEALFVVEGSNDERPTAAYVFAKGKTAIPRDKPIIVLDATADADALRAMTGREVIDHTPEGQIALVHDAIQFTADLTATTSAAEAANVLEAILKKYPDRGRVGVIGWRRAIDGIFKSDGLGESLKSRIVKTAYFWEGPDRGSNDWIKPVEAGGAGCDLLVVLGTPRPGTEPVRKLLIAMGQLDAARLPDGNWGGRKWQGTDAHGKAVVVEASGYLEPRWHAAYCLIVRAMLLQAIGRARASLPAGIPVVAVTVEPTGLPIADPLPILGTEVRQTTEIAIRLSDEAQSDLLSYREHFALRGWVTTSALTAALTAENAVRKKGHLTKPLSKRAALVRIERAVAAGRLQRGPRGWVGIVGLCDPWPTATTAPEAPSTPTVAAETLAAPPPVPRPSTIIWPPTAPVAAPAAMPPLAPITYFERRADPWPPPDRRSWRRREVAYAS